MSLENDSIKTWWTGGRKKISISFFLCLEIHQTYTDSIKKNKGSAPPAPVHPFVHMNLEKGYKGILPKTTFV